MSTGNRKLAPKAVALVIIVALLNVVGVSTVVIMFISGIVLTIWMIAQRSQRREVERIFEFYVAADAILREEDRRWFGFEVAEVIDSGERLLETMPDSPPLHFFTLGALYHRIGKHEAAAEYLSHVIEDQLYDERHRTSPSSQLRRYVETLRRLEHEPSIAPQTLAAFRSLERSRSKHAVQMLADSRSYLNAIESAAKRERTVKPAVENKNEVVYPLSPLGSVSTPPPISDVLHDIYQDDTNTSH